MCFLVLSGGVRARERGKDRQGSGLCRLGILVALHSTWYFGEGVTS